MEKGLIRLLRQLDVLNEQLQRQSGQLEQQSKQLTELQKAIEVKNGVKGRKEVDGR